ncbi:hypothetical protein C8A03DRAFT_36837 [Achaetomium macrosporum]|uniref:Cytosine-purine permease n=1 Tax=Achaetomium macrosporum TaxID=79813 RepID=A0AAN7C4X6_9PEZI|nr:hypothetical protein C8A03DRAFT_36837 [Achaetomium macrosporum]
MPLSSLPMKSTGTDFFPAHTWPRLYLVTIPLLPNAATATAFSLRSVVVAGQTLSSLSPDTVGITVGIVIGCLVAFAVSLLGLRALHMWERWTRIPNLISIVIALGCGGKHLHPQSHAEPAKPAVKIFLSLCAGFLLPSIPLLILGTAIGGAVPASPHGTTRGFGKLIFVLLALSVIGNIAISMYSVAMDLQVLLPFFANVHCFVFVLATMAIRIPFAILFQRLDYSTYDHASWNVGKKLQPGIAAIGASLVSMALVVPGLDEPWYTGPIANMAGDIGFEMAFVVTAICCLPFRWLEIRYPGRL